MKDIVRVVMADLGVARDPAVLVTIGLGSCVGVTLYDPVLKIAGMAHIMLPYQRRNSPGGKPGKFADRAIPLLIRELVSQGAEMGRLEAKIAGGAQMFPNKGVKESEIFRIGQRNVEASLAVLKEAGVRVKARDTGGSYGRTLELATKTGILRIKTIAHGEKYI